MELWIHFWVVRIAELGFCGRRQDYGAKNRAERREGLKGKTLPYCLCFELLVAL
jgi:hypothetical protein